MLKKQITNTTLVNASAGHKVLCVCTEKQNDAAYHHTRRARRALKDLRGDVLISKDQVSCDEYHQALLQQL